MNGDPDTNPAVESHWQWTHNDIDERLLAVLLVGASFQNPNTWTTAFRPKQSYNLLGLSLPSDFGDRPERVTSRHFNPKSTTGRYARSSSPSFSCLANFCSRPFAGI